MKVKPNTPIANGAPASAPPDMSPPLHSGDVEAIDTRQFVDRILGLPYETAIIIARQTIERKCGSSGTWHKFKVEYAEDGAHFVLWHVCISDGQTYNRETGTISIYRNGGFVSQPSGLRDTDNTVVLPSPSVGDFLPDNDFPQIAREVLNALIAAQGETASSGTETTQPEKRSSVPQITNNYYGPTFEAQGDITVSGDVAGRDKTTNQVIE